MSSVGVPLNDWPDGREVVGEETENVQHDFFWKDESYTCIRVVRCFLSFV